MGNGGNLHDRFAGWFAAEVSGVIRERPFHFVGCRVRVDIALEHDLGAGRDLQIDGFAFHQLDRATEDHAHHVPFANMFRERASGAERQDVVPTLDHGHGHVSFLALRQVGVFAEMAAPTLGRHEQRADPVSVEDLAAIEPDIGVTGLWIAGDHATERIDIFPAIAVMLLGGGELVQIDFGSGQDI